MFYLSKDGAENYCKAYFPVLAKKYDNLLGVDINADGTAIDDVSNIQSDVLLKIKDKLVTLLHSSFVLPADNIDTLIVQHMSQPSGGQPVPGNDPNLPLCSARKRQAVVLSPPQEITAQPGRAVSIVMVRHKSGSLFDLLVIYH